MSFVASLLMAQATLLAIYFLKRQGIHTAVLWILVFIGSLLFTAFQARSAALGLLCGGSYLLGSGLPKQKAIILSLVLVLFLVLLAIMDTGSSLGRMHIWKISLQLLQKQSWLKGVGEGNFNLAFNHEQIRYFATRDLLSKEAFLADDGYYAFNDYLQFGVQFGWLAFLLSMAAFTCWLFQLWAARKFGWGTSTSCWNTLLIPPAIASFMHYPLQIYWIQAGVAFCVLGLVADRAHHYKYVNGRQQRIILGLAAMLLILLGIVRQVKTLEAKQRFLAAKDQWNLGFKNAAIEQLSELYSLSPGNISVTCTLASYLHTTNNTTEAVSILEKHHEYTCNQKSHELLGCLYATQGNFDTALMHLKASLYITPHRLTSRALLANVHWLRGNYDSAIVYTRAVWALPLKVNTSEGRKLKKEAGAYLTRAPQQSVPFPALADKIEVFD